MIKKLLDEMQYNAIAFSLYKHLFNDKHNLFKINHRKKFFYVFCECLYTLAEYASAVELIDLKKNRYNSGNKIHTTSGSLFDILTIFIK